MTDGPSFIGVGRSGRSDLSTLTTAEAIDDERKRHIVDAILDECQIRGRHAVNEDRTSRGEKAIVENDSDEFFVEPEYPNGQVNFLADVVCEVLESFGWVEPDWQGRWALFGEDYLTGIRSSASESRAITPIPSGAYRMITRGGVPSFWRVLCQAAVRRGWIDQSAAPEEG